MSARSPETFPATSAARIDVGHLLDEGHWSGYQKRLVALTALAIVFDGIDNQLLGVAIPAIMQEWSAPRAAFAPVVSIGYAGMMVGGALAGLAGDRVGRRTALVASMVIFGLMTAAAGGASSPWQLAAVRFLAGAGLGGAIPNATALAAEYVPRRHRPVAITLTIVCVPLGATLAGLLGVHVMPLTGWRMLFIVGGAIPVLAAIVLFRVLPESPRYLVRHPPRWTELTRTLARMGHSAPTGTTFVDAMERPVGHASLPTLFERDLRADTVALFGAFFSCLLAVYLGFSWLTALLTSAGFDPATANIGITAFNLGGVVGALAGSVAIGGLGSRIPMLTMTAGAAAGAVGLSLMRIDASQPVWPILAMLTLTGGLINAVQTTMFALAAHVYPSAVRATGVGTTAGVGRLGAILSGYAGAWALDYRGSTSYFSLIAATMCVTFVSLALVGRHVPQNARRIAGSG
jgi:AAHS family 4-hydroxybenzoate transporter-like MFS transporter